MLFKKVQQEYARSPHLNLFNSLFIREICSFSYKFISSFLLLMLINLCKTVKKIIFFYEYYFNLFMLKLKII